MKMWKISYTHCVNAYNVFLYLLPYQNDQIVENNRFFNVLYIELIPVFGISFFVFSKKKNFCTSAPDIMARIELDCNVKAITDTNAHFRLFWIAVSIEIEHQITLGEITIEM